MAEVFLGLGSNLGNKIENIQTALARLRGESEAMQVSRLYRTAPVGYLHQDWFLNAVARVETVLAPLGVLRLIQGIERDLKRQRTVLNGPRTIDIDILFYDDRIIHNEDLIIPHPHLHERAFVLVPFAELAPDFRHPILGKTIAELLAVLPGVDASVEVFGTT